MDGTGVMYITPALIWYLDRGFWLSLEDLQLWPELECSPEKTVALATVHHAKFNLDRWMHIPRFNLNHAFGLLDLMPCVSLLTLAYRGNALLDH
jgi:hypothetical protein